QAYPLKIYQSLDYPFIGIGRGSSMPSSRGLSLLLTASQAADRLGVSVERVLLWAADGRLRIAGQDEDGRALFREHIIETIGEDLVALTPAEGKRQRHLRPNRDVDPHA